jgi:hypothetical protein
VRKNLLVTIGMNMERNATFRLEIRYAHALMYKSG